MLNIRTQIRTYLNPSKRIRSRIRSKNIRTVLIPRQGTKTVVHCKVNHNCIKQPGHSNTTGEFGPELGVCITCRSGQNSKARQGHTHSLQLHACNKPCMETLKSQQLLNTKQAAENYLWHTILIYIANNIFSLGQLIYITYI